MDWLLDSDTLVSQQIFGNSEEQNSLVSLLRSAIQLPQYSSRDVFRQQSPRFCELVDSILRETNSEWAQQLEDIVKDPREVAELRELSLGAELEGSTDNQTERYFEAAWKALAQLHCKQTKSHMQAASSNLVDCNQLESLVKKARRAGVEDVLQIKMLLDVAEAFCRIAGGTDGRAGLEKILEMQVEVCRIVNKSIYFEVECKRFTSEVKDKFDILKSIVLYKDRLKLKEDIEFFNDQVVKPIANLLFLKKSYLKNKQLKSGKNAVGADAQQKCTKKRFLKHEHKNSIRFNDEFLDKIQYFQRNMRSLKCDLTDKNIETFQEQISEYLTSDFLILCQ